MAWEQGEFCGKPIVVGDKPIDEFNLCLKKIAAEYTDRYERKPTVAEILYSFGMAVSCNSEEYFSDPATADRAIIAIERSH